MRRPSALILACAIACAAAPAVAADRPTAEEAPLMRAAQACLALDENGEPARARLLAMGWERSTPPKDFARGKGRMNEFYAKGRDGVLLTLDPTGCLFNVFVPRHLKTPRVMRILSAALGADPLSMSESSATWGIGKHQAAHAVHQRKRNEASVQLIMTSSQGKKN